MDLLVISYSVPFDSVGSAGEKTHNYYLKSFQREKDISVSLISFGTDKDRDKLDLNNYGIKNRILIEKQDRISRLKRNVKRACGIVVRPDDKYASFVSGLRRTFVEKSLCQWKENGYKPDVIILEWTHMILLIDLVKEVYPEVPIVSSVHDISYIGSKRRWYYERNSFVKYFRKRQFMNLRQREILALEKCDMIVPHNDNDVSILQRHTRLKNKKYLRIVPYYDDYSHIVRKPEESMMIFFGNLNRPENYMSVIWFIEEVFRKLDGNWKFIIIGGNPPKTIQEYRSERIEVTGYLPQKEVEEYFSKCTCMVVPLQLGSGIKVKILEAFSAGVPVLTNTIGIEGIYAENGKEYIHCESPDDYIEQLNDISKEKLEIEFIGEAGREFVKNRHNLEKSKKVYIQELREIYKKED